MAVACSEKTLKLTPAASSVAPSGALVLGRTVMPSACSSAVAALDTVLVRMSFSRIGVRYRGASVENVVRAGPREEFDERGNETGPARLMACSETGAAVAVEVFVEKKVIAPKRIALEPVSSRIHRAPAVLVRQEDTDKACRDLVRN